MKQPFKGRFQTSWNDRKRQGWQQTKQLPHTYDGEQIYSEIGGLRQKKGKRQENPIFTVGVADVI
ncbi:hypothetical protein, partial [Candidatus Magnetominusculus dajiuhuensis]|uniref:hypothetical protein n=1 Tax=Candidatus Magnetominusculus dajiuhuensis TaxID=3137712 RepID=UPI003B42EF36